MSTLSHTAIITGASRGIGFSIAKAFARDGIRLMIVGRDPVRLAEAQSTLAKEGFSAEVFSADVSLDTGVRALQQAALAKFDRVDILVNSAGSAVSSPFLKTDLQSWNSMIESHLTSTYRCMQAFLPGMLERGYGRIVNIASIAGKIGFQYTSAYCAAKHGVLGLTKAVALEVAQKGVTVNAVCPGWVDTPMTEETIRNISSKTGWPAEKAKTFLEEQSPLHRLISPEEVAATVLFLVSAGASAINGQAINVCGGEVFS
jgi:NAD(P)-dependent dehydrogenase (short-subunit alcohol dehydrogenase family)